MCQEGGRFGGREGMWCCVGFLVARVCSSIVVGLGCCSRERDIGGGGGRVLCSVARCQALSSDAQPVFVLHTTHAAVQMPNAIALCLGIILSIHVSSQHVTRMIFPVLRQM